MTFSVKPMTELPKRQPPKASEVDLEAAQALFDMLTEGGQPAMIADPNDAKKKVGVVADNDERYDLQKDARNAANVAKRLLGHVRGNLFVRTRVFKPEGSEKWAFVIWLSTDDPNAPKAKAAKATK